MSLQHAKIAGYGSYLPEKILGNTELAKTLSTTDDWIVSHTGIHSRHIIADDQAPSDMAVIAAQRALKKAGIEAKDIGMILLTTCSGDYYNLPATACIVQDRIGATNAAAFDLCAACSGFTYALHFAKLHVISSQKPLLLISVEALSRIADWSDRGTCILFGDGAAAAVITPSDTPSILGSYLGSDGSRAELLRVDGGCKEIRHPDDPISYVKMSGHATFSFAVRTFEKVINQLLQDHNLTAEDISYIIPHQANMRIIEAVGRRMELPEEKFFMNISHVANTSSASIPLALFELADSGKIKSGDYILTVAFGAGVTYGGNIIHWS
ncbi:MAG: beta-ketoacyl-ACP synthase III [Lentisphaeria bacterium]